MARLLKLIDNLEQKLNEAEVSDTGNMNQSFGDLLHIREKENEEKNR